MDNPRAWARPHDEGDPWHEYWEPENPLVQRPWMGAIGGNLDTAPAEVQHRRRQWGRRIALVWLIAMPISIVADIVLWNRPGALPGAAICAILTLGGLIRARAIGERSVTVTVLLTVLFFAWVGIVLAHIV
jgi:hypothetical protein